MKIRWRPSLTFEEGLEKTVDWYLANQDWVDNALQNSKKNNDTKRKSKGID